MLARIVVIEDDVYMREELIDMLKKAGYDAVPLPAFENAVSQLAELSPDLILLDINLPFRSGFEICKEIKANHLGAVLILTAQILETFSGIFSEISLADAEVLPVQEADP